MKSAAIPTFVLVLALAVPGCSRSPASWKEWMDEAPQAWKAQNFGLVLEVCAKAFEYADREANGPRALGSLECMAEAAARHNQMEKVFAPFERVLSTYDNDLRASGAGLRLRNNYAVALVEAGRKQEGVDLLDATLDVYEGTPQSSVNNFRVRMQLVSNLARAVRVFPDSEPSVRVSTDILKEILNHLDNERFHKNFAFTLGTADAMAAIAELIRLRGDPRHAGELVAQAKEQLAVEDAILAGQQRRIPCESITIRSLALRPCYAALR